MMKAVFQCITNVFIFISLYSGDLSGVSAGVVENDKGMWSLAVNGTE